MKLKAHKRIRLGLVAGLVATGLVGVTSLTASGEPAPQEVIGQLRLDVPGGSGRTGTVSFYPVEPGGGFSTDPTAQQFIAATAACPTLEFTGTPLLDIVAEPGTAVLPNNGIGVTDNTNCGSSAAIVDGEGLRLRLLNDFFGDNNVDVSTATLDVFKDNGGGQLKVGELTKQLSNGLNLSVDVGGFLDSVLVSSTAQNDNKGIYLRGATFTLVQDIPNEAPVADFTSVVDGLDVDFTDTSTDPDGDETIVAWSWNFGDGNTSSAQSPSHTYTTAGEYDVTLTVTDNLGATDTITKQVVANQAPVADFTFVVDGLDVDFTDTSTDPDGDETIVAWSWNFGDDNTSSDQSPSHTYTTAGEYDVTLTVTDNLGATDTITKQVVANQAPVADFTFSTNAPLRVDFTDTSTDPDGDETIVAWSWNFGDGNTSSDQSPSQTYPAVGEYDVTLTVTDNRGATDTTTKQVEVKFDEAVGCGEERTSPPGEAGDIANTVTFRRGENSDRESASCVDVGVTLQIVNDPDNNDGNVAGGQKQFVYWDNNDVGVDGSEQGVEGLVTIEWAPVPVGDVGVTVDLDRKIDYDGYGPGTAKDTLWCLSFETTDEDSDGVPEYVVERPAYDGPEAILIGDDPISRAPWCLVSDTRELIGGEIHQTEVMFGGGDPMKW